MATIDPLDCSEAMERIENPPIVTISAEQWSAIEAAAEQAGEAGRATGNLYRWGLAAHDRLITLAQMPGAGIVTLLNHLLWLRRDDLLEAILSADYDGEIVHELAIRSAGIEAEREKAASRYRPPQQKPQQSSGENPVAAAAVRRREQRWQDAQDNAEETLDKIARITGSSRPNTRAALDKVCALLGIKYYSKAEYGVSTMPTREELAEQVEDRLAILESLAAAEPAPVAAAGPAPLTAEVLIAEALDPQRRQPTTVEAIAGWRARPGTPWRDWFRHLRDWVGPSAAAAIAEATGAPFDAVVERGREVWARHDGELEQLRAAYPTLQELLADAVEARGWEWLSAGLGLGIEALWGHAAALARAEGVEDPADQRPSAA